MRKAAILALCLFTAAGLAGCGDFAPPADTQAVPAASQQIPAEREATLRLYLPDEDGMHVSLRESKVPAKQMTLKNALVQLIRLDREQKYPLLPTGLTIKDVSIEDGTAVINFSGQLKNLSGGTTAQEARAELSAIAIRERLSVVFIAGLFLIFIFYKTVHEFADHLLKHHSRLRTTNLAARFQNFFIGTGNKSDVLFAQKTGS